MYIIYIGSLLKLTQQIWSIRIWCLLFQKCLNGFNACYQKILTVAYWEEVCTVLLWRLSIWDCALRDHCPSLSAVGNMHGSIWKENQAREWQVLIRLLDTPVFFATHHSREKAKNCSSFLPCFLVETSSTKTKCTNQRKGEKTHCEEY